MDDSASTKAPSVRCSSVASQNSTASAVSLTRRPRARTRSRTVTGASSTRAVDSQLPYLDKELVQDPLPQSLDNVMGPPPTPKPYSSATPTTQNTDLAAAETTFVETHSPVFGKLPAKASLASKSSLPAIHTRYQPPPSAFSRDPSHTPNVRDSVSTHQSNASSSLYPLSSSSASGPESPMSPRSMSEQFDHMDAVRIDPEPPNVQEFDSDDVAYRLKLLVKNNYFLPPAHSKPSPSDFAAIAAANPKKQLTKSSPVAFLDLFRAGKPKSKPPTPTGSPHFDAPLPMLRATSDSITAPHAAHAQQPRVVSAQATLARHPPRPPPSKGRVVVVREKMGDISAAAKQAEQDLKNKGVRLDKPPPEVTQDIFDDVVDPTDAVDLPLPSASYPFAVQASALRGLGVHDSLGADVLAERLPPSSQTADQSSSFEIDSLWRKALLHKAVAISLDNTPDASFTQAPEVATTPVSSVRKRSKSAAPPPNPEHRRGQVFDPLEDLPARPPGLLAPRPIAPRAVPSTGLGSSLQAPEDPDASIDSRTSSYIPPRVETPSSPMLPLQPPPRRQVLQTFQSTSHTDLSTPPKELGDYRPTSSSSRRTLRRARSSPILADFEPLTRRTAEAMHSPPMPNDSLIHSTRTTMSFETNRDSMDQNGVVAGSIYSDDELIFPHDDDETGRRSFALSAIHGRPSLSEYSQESWSPSPTTSAFQDALNYRSGWHSDGSSANFQSSHDHHSAQSNAAERGRNAHPAPQPSPRGSTMSPPPRMSSSLAHFSALPPPPRSAATQQAYSNSFLRPASIDSAASSEPSFPTAARSETLHFSEPAPTTPPLPIISLQRSSVHGLSLELPRQTMSRSGSVEAAEPSPTAFFDTLETQHNAAMDDESTSEEEEEESDEDARGDHVQEMVVHHHHHHSHHDLHNQHHHHHSPSSPLPSPQRPSFPPETRARTTSAASAPVPLLSPLMKFGNHSVPYVKQVAESLRHVPLPGLGGGSSHSASGHEASTNSIASMQPVGNVVGKAAFFADRKNEAESSSPVSPYNLYLKQQQLQAGASASSLAVSTASDSRLSNAGTSATSGTSHRRPSVGGGGGGTSSSVVEGRPSFCGTFSSVSSKAQSEEARKLDGMLLQHMEAEKGTIKRIAIASSTGMGMKAGARAAAFSTPQPPAPSPPPPSSMPHQSEWAEGAFSTGAPSEAGSIMEREAVVVGTSTSLLRPAEVSASIYGP